MIKASGISKNYGSLQVLKNINLTVNKGELVTLVGPSGAGKSTLLQIIGTLDKPDTGTVNIAGTDIEKLKEKQLAEFRNKHIGFVFQFHHLLPEFTALENVCIPAFIKGTSESESAARAKELLNYLNLSHRYNHKPSELSGGEQQRVAVARAMMNDAELILADEPSGNLDSKNADDLHNLFFKLRNDFNKTFVIVTHNEAFADMADRKLMMRDGEIIQ